MEGVESMMGNSIGTPNVTTVRACGQMLSGRYASGTSPYSAQRSTGAKPTTLTPNWRARRATACCSRTEGGRTVTWRATLSARVRAGALRWADRDRDGLAKHDLRGAMPLTRTNILHNGFAIRQRR